jgi:hypothetical protein
MNPALKKKLQRPYFHERSFGVSVGGVLVLIAAWAVWRQRLVLAAWLGGIGALLILLGQTAPWLLKWPSAAWWKLAHVLGYVNARVILTLIFAIVLTPMGLLWRLINHDPLTQRRRNWSGWSKSPDRFRDPNHFRRMY